MRKVISFLLITLPFWANSQRLNKWAPQGSADQAVNQMSLFKADLSLNTYSAPPTRYAIDPLTHDTIKTDFWRDTLGNILSWNESNQPVVIATAESGTFKGTLAEARQKADGYATVTTTDYVGGTWYYDALDNISTDNIGTVFVTNSGRRYKRIFSGDVNVQWFGAKPGYVYDATTSIQNAINSLPKGGVVYIPSGVYKISNSIHLHSGIVIRGDANNYRDTAFGSVLKTANVSSLADSPILNVNNTRYCVVKYLTFTTPDTNGYNLANTAMGISDWSDPNYQASFCLIEHCQFRFIGGHQISLYGNVNTVQYNSSRDCQSTFIFLKNSLIGQGTGSDNFILFNESGDGGKNATSEGGGGPSVGDGTNGDGIRIEDGSTNLIQGNLCFNRRYGIVLFLANVGQGCFSNRVVNNRCEKNDGPGIYIFGGGQNLIQNNHTWNNGGVPARGKHGISISTSTGNLVQGNLIHNWPFSWGGGTSIGSLDGNTDNGIVVSGGSMNSIISNKVYNVNQVGILVTSESYSKISNNETFLTGREGIILSDACADNQVSNNYIVKAGQLSNATYDGIFVGGTSTRNAIQGNMVRHGGGSIKSRYGIRINGSSASNNTVYNNDLQLSGDAGTYFNSGASTEARHNRGWISETAGIATIQAVDTSVIVTHGADFTPTVRNLSVVATNNLGNSTKWWVENIGPTQFTIRVNIAPGSTLATFAWSVKQTISGQ